MTVPRGSRWLLRPFSLKGRDTRSDFAKAALPAYVLMFFSLALPGIVTRYHLAIGLPGTLGPWAVAVTYVPPLLTLAALLPTFAGLARRLHDLGRSARMAAVLVFGPPVLVWLPWLFAVLFLNVIHPQQGIADDGRGIGSAILGVALFLGTLLASLVAQVVIGLRPSQSGPNKYGPNPHEVTP